MQTRRLQRTGGSTLIVSLPKPWTKRMDLTAGDVVGIVEQENGTLVVNPNITPSDQLLRAEVMAGDEPPEQLTRALISGYLGGAHLLKVRSADRFSVAQRQAVREFANLVIGPEIVDETAASILLQDLTDIGSLPLRTALKRLYRIVKAMQRDAIASLTEGAPELTANIADRDVEVDKLYWFITRVCNLLIAQPWLAERLETSISKGIAYMLVARALERIGDHAVQMAEGLNLTGQDKLDPPAGPVEEIARLSGSILTLLQEGVDSFFNEKSNQANLTIDKGKHLAASCARFQASKVLAAGERGLPLLGMAESLRRVALYTTDIAETTLNTTLQPMSN